MVSSEESRTNTLPPIKSPHPPISSPPQRLASPADGARPHKSTENIQESRISGRKRTRTEESEKGLRTSSAVRVKEEDYDNPDHGHGSKEFSQDGCSVVPTPVSLAPSSSKKRRTTLSTGPHPLMTSQLPPAEHSSSAAISPVVRGCTVRDEEQIRSSLSVKNHQKALIEQRRGSLPMLSSNPPMNSTEERGNFSSRHSSRRSPSGHSNVIGSRPRANSPPLMASHHPQVHTGPVSIATHSLPPPPISFTDRRAGQIGALKKKPADILISPRETQTPEQLQLEIQSAPPVPHARQQGGSGSRFPMALPRLPSVLGGGHDSIKRVVSTYVPPTPSRLSRSIQPTTASGMGQSNAPAGNGRSPPMVPIASTLVPPTPSFLQQSAPSNGDKAAFLAPFEFFYDALNDSRQLKIWLTEQIQRSNTLMQSLTRQQERLDETVETLVEKRTGSLKSEIAGLYRRVEDLEDALRVAGTSRHYPNNEGSSHLSHPLHHQGKSVSRNGAHHHSATTSESAYTFPPSHPSSESRGGPSFHRPPSPGWNGERPREPPSHHDEYHDSMSSSSPPNSYDKRRLSVSAMRMETHRTESWERDYPSSHTSSYSKSPRVAMFRDANGPPVPAMGSPRPSDRPGLLRKISSSRVHGSTNSRNESAEGSRSGEREIDTSSAAMDTTK
jgi:hypothetical protein